MKNTHKIKKLLASLLSLILTVSMVAGTLFNTTIAKADVDATQSSKAAEWVTEGERARITFTINTEDEVFTDTIFKKTDIVLVIDTSESMSANDGGQSRLARARAAASDFVNSLLTPDYSSLINIAIVEFASDARDGSYVTTSDYWDWIPPFHHVIHTVNTPGLTNNATELNNVIDELEAGGGTNTQAGIMKAEEILAASTTGATNQIIVVISDGEPTYSYKGDGTNSYNTVLNTGELDKLYKKFDYDKLVGDGYHYTFNGGAKNHGLPTVSEAQFAKDNGISIFSVGISVDGNANAEYVMKNIATDLNHYYSSPSSSALAGVLSTVSETIIQELSAGTGAVLTDGIPSYFTVDETSVLVDGVAAPVGTVTVAGSTLTWNIGDFEVGKETYTLSFEMILDKSGLAPLSFYPTANLPTNTSSALNYTDNTETLRTISFENQVLPLVAYKYDVTYTYDGAHADETTSFYAFAGSSVTVADSAEFLLNSTRYNAELTSVTPSRTFTMPANDTTVLVVYQQNEYTFTFNYWDEAGQVVTTTVENIVWGSSLTPPVVPDVVTGGALREFNGWIGNSYNNITANGSATATDQFTFDVTFLYGNGLSTVIMVAEGGFINAEDVPANTDKNADLYHTFMFAGWDKPTTDAINEPTVITALYEEIPIDYIVTIVLKSTDGAFTESFTSFTKQYLESFAAPEVPLLKMNGEIQYYLLGWDSNVVAGMITADANKTVYANYEVVQVEVTPTPDPSPSPTPVEPTLPPAEPTTPPVEPTQPPVEPTAVPTPIVVEIPADETPEALPEVTPEIVPTEVPEVVPEVIPEEVPEVVPTDVPEEPIIIEEDGIAEASVDILPQTGTTSNILLYFLGAAFVLAGFITIGKNSTRKRKELN